RENETRAEMSCAIWRQSHLIFLRLRLCRASSLPRSLPPCRANREIEIAPRRLAAAGVPQAEAAIRQAQERVPRRTVLFPVVLRLRPEDRVFGVLRPLQAVFAGGEAQGGVLVVVPIAAVEHQ